MARQIILCPNTLVEAMVGAPEGLAMEVCGIVDGCRLQLPGAGRVPVDEVSWAL